MLVNICVTQRAGITLAAVAENAGWGTHMEAKFCRVLSSSLSQWVSREDGVAV